MASKVFVKRPAGATVPSAKSSKRASRFVNKDPSVSAIISKLVSDLFPKSRRTIQGDEVGAPPEIMVQKISDETANSINDAEALMQLLPDLKQGRQIRISSILSPNDLITSEMTVSVEETALDSSLVSKMLAYVTNLVEREYRVKEILGPILNDVLFDKGSYPIMVLPESAIDNVINSDTHVNMESLAGEFNRNTKQLNFRGILGPSNAELERINSKRVSVENGVYGMLGMEALTIDVNRTSSGTIVEVSEGTDANSVTKPLLTVTDNTDILKLPLVQEKVAKDRLAEAQNVPSELLSHSKIESLFYKDRHYKWTPVAAVKPLSRLEKPTVGHPLVMVLPPESVIPVHVPGNPSEHVGYFVVLDPTGHPINRAEFQNFYSDMSQNITQNRDMVTQLISQTRRAWVGNSSNNQMESEELIAAYTRMVENDLLERLKNGVYGESVHIARPTEIYRIMLARALSRMKTQMLYVPKSLLTYIAFEYTFRGIGKSAVEDSKILGSMRAMLLFANTMAEIKNSVQHVTLNIELDPEDPNPSRTVEYYLHEYAKNRQSSFPIGASNPLDIVNFLQNAGLNVVVSGHEGYPVTSMKAEDVKSDRVEVNTALMEDFENRHLQAIGVPPQSAKDASNVEFATVVTHQNLLFAKQTIQDQELLMSQVTEHVRIFCRNSGTVLSELGKMVEEYKVNAPEALKTKSNLVFIATFLSALKLSLPSPNTASIEKLSEEFNTYSDALDKGIAAYIDSSFLNNSNMGEVANVLEPLKAAIKAHFQRKWMRENGYLSELDSLVQWDSKTGKGLNLLRETSLHADSLSKALMPFVIEMTKTIKKRDEILQANGGAPEASPGSSEGEQMGGEESPFGGGDEEAFNEETSGNEKEPKDESTEENETTETPGGTGVNKEAEGNTEGNAE